MATKNITIQEKTEAGYDECFPETTINQVQGLNDKLDGKIPVDISTLQSTTAQNTDNIIVGRQNKSYSVKITDITNIVNPQKFIVSDTLPEQLKTGDIWVQTLKQATT